MDFQSGKAVSGKAHVRLLAGAMLAGVMGLSYVAVAATLPEPPAPPSPPEALAAPVPPVPPAPPAPPAVERNVVIVERHGPDGENAASHIRTVTRDGKTFVFETDKPMSDAEVERRIAEAEARSPPVPPVPPVPGRDMRRVQQRVVVMNDKGEGVTDVITEEAGRCHAGAVLSDVDTSAQEDGKVTRVRIRMCGTHGEIEKHARAEAVRGLRSARDDIARDMSLSDTIRKEILKDLDEELARLKS